MRSYRNEPTNGARHLVALLWVFIFCPPVFAMFSLDDTLADPVDPFSPAFHQAYEQAKFGSGPPDEAHRFEELVKKFVQPPEQAELELTLGVIYNQRTGLVDNKKSIVHMSNALRYKLPRVVLIKTYLWRGNSFEVTNQTLDALRDYVRGLELCLDYDVPEKSPSYPVLEKVPYMNAPNTRENETAFHEMKSKLAQYRLESDIIQKRYYYVDAVQRVLAQKNISRESFEALVADSCKSKQTVKWILKRAYSPNVRPW